MTTSKSKTQPQGAKKRQVGARLLPSFEGRMMAPGILVLLAITVFPFLAIIFMSFNEVSPIGGLSFDFIGLENWKAVFTDPAIRSSWAVSLVYFVSALIIEMVLGVAIALLVHELVWGKNLAISLLIMPIFMAPVIVGLVGRFMVSSPYGLYAWALESSGIYTSSILGNGTSALFAVILMDVWEWTPLITLIVLAGLSSVSQDVQEAARVDGAGYWQRLRHITAPMIAGVVIVALLIRSMDLIRYFDKILVTTNGGPADATKIIPVRLYETAFRFFELGYASAIGFSMLVFSIIVALIFVQVLRKKELLP